jgi:target of rapamycin complex 2 subunit MAPKAP1
MAALAPPPALAPSLSALSASNLGTSLGPLSTSLNVSSSHGSQVLLKIRVASAETDKALLLSTTISVYVTHATSLPFHANKSR